MKPFDFHRTSPSCFIPPLPALCGLGSRVDLGLGGLGGDCRIRKVTYLSIRLMLMSGETVLQSKLSVKKMVQDGEWRISTPGLSSLAKQRSNRLC